MRHTSSYAGCFPCIVSVTHNHGNIASTLGSWLQHVWHLKRDCTIGFTFTCMFTVCTYVCSMGWVLWTYVHVFYVMLSFPTYLVNGNLWSVGFSPLSPVFTFPFHPFLGPTPLQCPPPLVCLVSYSLLLLTLFSLPLYSTPSLLHLTPSPLSTLFPRSLSFSFLSFLLFSLFLPPLFSLPFYHFSLLSSCLPLLSLFSLPFYHFSLLSSLLSLLCPLLSSLFLLLFPLTYLTALTSLPLICSEYPRQSKWSQRSLFLHM